MTKQETYFQQRHWDAVHLSADSGQGGQGLAALHSSVAAALGRDARDPGRRVLDVACGSGVFLRGLADGPTRVGMDFSVEGLRLARRSENGEACVWLQADATRVPLGDGTIDAAVCLSSIWALSDPVGGLRELARVVRPQGRLLVHLWGWPADCRLLTLGAVAIARVLPDMRLPDGVTGPFGLTREGLTAWAGAAGWSLSEWHQHAHRTEIRRPADYWREFALLAPTAYAAYRSAGARQQARIEGLLERLLGQVRERDGEGGLDLSWQLLLFTA